MRRLVLATSSAAFALVLAAPLVATPPAIADEPGASPVAARKLATQQQVALATPGDFTGHGFDQCLAPTQSAMNTWWKKSPFSAVGIYISGDSRACRSQPNLSPTWVATQVARGWRLLPIVLGPQASCQPRFPRYKDDFRISPRPAGGYAVAAQQGTAEADKNAADAMAYGIAPGSTIWYDLEGFNVNDTHCRESALVFTSAWVTRMKALGYVAGFYSSASSGIKMLDDARRLRPGQFALPDRIWIARWDGVANTSTTYIPEDGWRPGLAGRPQVHPYRHLREAPLDRTARRRSAYDDQARLDRRVGAPAPARAQRGARRTLPGERRVRREDRDRAAEVPVPPADRRLRRRDAPDLEQAAAGSLRRRP